MSYSDFHIDYQVSSTLFLGFWREHFPKWPQTKFDWFYLSNPAGSAIGYGIREQSSSEMVGASAVFPRQLWVDGRERLGGIVGDLGVHPNHRTLGPALKLQKTTLTGARKEGIEILYGFPNRLAKPVQKRVGYQPIGRVIRVSRILRSYGRLKRRINLPLVTRLLAAIIDIAVRLLSREGHSSLPSNFRSAIVDRFDQRFDRLWNKAKYNHTILGVRDQSFLNWRFSACPNKNYRTFILEDIDIDDVVGYIVYYQSDDDFIIADVLATGQDRLQNLISSFIKYGRRSGVSAITMVLTCGNDLLDFFRTMRFVVRQTDERLMIYLDECDPQAEILLEGENWYLTEGDNDV